MTGPVDLYAGVFVSPSCWAPASQRVLSAPVSPARRAALADTPRQLRDYMAGRTLYSGLAALLNVKLIFPGHLSWNIPASGHAAFEVPAPGQGHHKQTCFAMWPCSKQARLQQRPKCGGSLACCRVSWAPPKAGSVLSGTSLLAASAVMFYFVCFVCLATPSVPVVA